jgi:queuine tRNA-ribosyltransferase
MPDFSFTVIHQSKKSKARVGQIHTPHGVINTPNFVAVGTNGTIKALDNRLVDQIGLQLMFCNTYHLMLQPGADVVGQAGGLHRYINRKLPIITDSGGFQVFSLAYGSVASELKGCGIKKGESLIQKISEEGVIFRSYRDGSKLLLSPESSIDAQKKLGADIIIPFDELVPYHISEKALRDSFDRTHRWEVRSLQRHLQKPAKQAMYAVIHGGIDPDLRRESAMLLSNEPFDGFAIGGSLGKTKKEMHTMLEDLMPHLPKEKPNHLLGIGDRRSLEMVIPLGIDTLDSSYPTRAARHGMVLTQTGDLKISQKKHASHFSALDPTCSCYTCQNYTTAYLHHLFKAKELTAYTLLTIHNLSFMVDMMKRIREKIQNDLL